jgi:hypothetical protein
MLVVKFISYSQGKQVKMCFELKYEMMEFHVKNDVKMIK